MKPRLIKAGSILFAALAGAYGALKFATDWVGRSTFLEDLNTLGDRIAGLLTYLADQPPLVFYWIPIGLITTAIVLAYHQEISAALTREKPPVPAERLTLEDYEAWDLSPNLTLWQAAYLWAGLKPAQGGIMADAVRPRYQMLHHAVDTNEMTEVLPAVRGGPKTQYIERAPRPRMTEYSTQVSRADLIKVAEARKQRPPFLFPDERHGHFNIRL